MYFPSPAHLTLMCTLIPAAPQHLLGTPMSLLNTMGGDGRGNAEWPSPSSRVQDVQSAFSTASITDYIRELQRFV